MSISAKTGSVLDHVDIFALEIAGRRIGTGRDAMVVDFEFDEKEKSSAEAKFTIYPPDGEALHSTVPIVKGSKVLVRWGYLGHLSELLEMKVHSTNPTYGTKGYQLEVVARDKGSDLGHFARQTVYSNTELGAVVNRVAERIGLDAVLPRNAQGDINGVAFKKIVKWKGSAQDFGNRDDFTLKNRVPTSPMEAKLLKEVVTLHQGNRSDRALLHWIAHRTGCRMSIVGGKLHFVPEHYAASPTHAFRWRNGTGTLLEFKIKASEGGKQTTPARGVTANGVDPLTKKAFAYTAKDGNRPGRPVMGAASPFGGPGADGAPAAGADVVAISSRNGDRPVDKTKATPVTAPDSVGRAFAVERKQGAKADQRTTFAGAEKNGVFIPTGSGRASEAKRNADAMHGEAEGGGIKATFSTEGIPSLRRNQVMQISGLDAVDSGNYLITGVSHKISAQGGYQCSGEAKRHGSNNKKQPKTKGKGNESKPSDPDQAPIARFLVASKQGGAIVGMVKK